jgi:DNA modification methylase
LARLLRDITPPEDIVDDMLLLSGRNLAALVRAAHLAVSDWRDLRVAAEKLRAIKPT